MFKKTLALAIFSLSAGVYADGILPAKAYHYEAGKYIGLSLGPRTSTSGTPLFYEGGEGTLSVGYGHVWSDYLYWQRTYTAVEGFIGDSVPFKKYGPNPATSVTSLETGFGYGIDGILGYMINPYSILYARGGVVNTQFQMNVVNTLYPEQTTYHTAWRVGGGVQSNVIGNLDLRAEYVYALYPEQTQPVNIGRQWSNFLNFGVVYRFV